MLGKVRAVVAWLTALVICCTALYGKDTSTAKNVPKKDDKAKGQPAPEPANLIWPLPPDPVRIRWIAEYTDMAKIQHPGAKKSRWLDRLTGTKTQDEQLELRKPYGIATDSKGRIYAADTELRTVFVIDAVARTVDRRSGTSQAPLVLPAGVALDSSDRLFVSDAALHSVVCFSPSGQAVATFGTTVLGRPGGIAIDHQRSRLYVADAKQSRIAVFDIASLKFVSYIGGPGKPGHSDNGTFFGPTNVAVDRKGSIYVADTLNCRVQIFDPSGNFVRAFGTQGDVPGEFIRPKGIAVDSEGHVYVADAEFNNFQILTSEGQPLLAVGNLGTDPGQFSLIAGLYIDAKDRIYTTEMFRGRIQVFQYVPQPGSADVKEVTGETIR